MEKYRKSLKSQNAVIAAGILCLITVQILAAFRVFAPVVSDEHWADMYAGFIAGAALGVTILLLVGFIKNLRALRSEAELKKFYAKEHDERRMQICYNAQSGAYRVCTLALLVAIVVTGYFSVTVSLTCLVLVFVQSIIGGIFKLCWSRKL